MFKKLFAIIFIISTLLFVLSGCMISQDELLQKVISDVKDNDFSNVQKNIKNMKTETLEQLKTELDKSIVNDLKERDYKKVETFINNLNDISFLADYLEIKNKEVSDLKRAEAIYIRAKELYNSISKITDETKKRAKIKECYNWFNAIDANLNKYFIDLPEKSNEIKAEYKKNVSLESIKSAKQLVENNDYVKAILVLENVLKISDYKNDEIMQLVKQYKADCEEYINNQIEVIKLDTGEKKYVSKDIEEDNDFNFYAYLIKRSETTYDLKLVVAAKTNLNIVRIEIPKGAGRWYILRESDKNADKLESGDTYQLTYNYFSDQVIRDIIVYNNSVTVKFVYDDDKFKEYNVSTKQLKALKDIIGFRNLK